MSRSPEQNNRRPVALTPEDRPRRRRVYFARVVEVKGYDQAVSSWCLSVALFSPFKLYNLVRVRHCAPCYVVEELKAGVDKGIMRKAALPKALREV